MSERDLLAYAPPPYELRPSLFDRAHRRIRELTATPRGASLATLWMVALVALLFTVAPVSAEAADDRGAMTTSCGMDVVVFGHPNAAAERACRSAIGGRAIFFFLALTAVLTGLVVALLPAIRARLGTPRRAGLAVGAALAAVIMALTLRSVPVEVGEEQMSVRCGVDAVLLGHPIDAVQDACRDTATGQSVLFVLALGALLACAVGLLRLRPSPSRIALAAGAVIALAVVAIAMRPLTIEVADARGGTMLVSCGIDSAVVGHGIESVERACRDEVGAHGAAFVGALLVLGVAALGLARTRSEWRSA